MTVEIINSKISKDKFFAEISYKTETSYVEMSIPCCEYIEGSWIDVTGDDLVIPEVAAEFDKLKVAFTDSIKKNYKLTVKV
jgi:hypothetical protein